MNTFDFPVNSSDAIRAYIIALRRFRGVSQDTLASGIGMAQRTYEAWEAGDIKDIKTPFLVQAIRFLRGNLTHLDQLLDATPEVAEKLAHLSDAQVATIEQIAATEPERAALLRRVMEITNDPKRVERLSGYLDGLDSSR